jgi:hypothetical protein
MDVLLQGALVEDGHCTARRAPIKSDAIGRTTDVPLIA